MFITNPSECFVFKMVADGREKLYYPPTLKIFLGVVLFLEDFKRLLYKISISKTIDI